MKKIGLLVVTVLFSVIGFTQNHTIIPCPVSFTSTVNDSFVVDGATVISLNKENEETKRLGKLLADHIAYLGGPELRVMKNCRIKSYRSNNHATKVIRLEIVKNSKLPSEGYELTVGKNGIQLTSHTGQGLFYGLQTLFQLIPGEFSPTFEGMVNQPFDRPNNKVSGIIEKDTAALGATLVIAGCKIIDYPRLAYRGMHLDVARHLFPVEFIKEYIDLMALYKMNNFHWHLTDDQGWRLAIKKYPLLTEVGSWRNSSPIGRNEGQDNVAYGGFYTQQEAREIVQYAKDRYINVIPEIELPGHAQAALAAYPYLSCNGGPFQVWTQWGVSENIFCAGNEKTFEFLEDVLDEVMDIFPSQYIHIGGDEAPKTRWNECPLCKQRMVDEHLEDANQLQSYFTQRIEKYLNKHGRMIIGWDEILEGGLAPGATVMSWRGTEGGIAAAQLNHPVIMTPGSFCYFDHYQADPAGEPFAIGGYNTLQNTYSFDPVPVELPTDKQKYILGAQGNVWTEYIHTSESVEYMAYPRAIALAEINWSPADSKDWERFIYSLEKHYNRLDRLGINYSRSSHKVQIHSVFDTVTRKQRVILTSQIPNAHMSFCVNNGPETAYSSPFEIYRTSEIKAFLPATDGRWRKESSRTILLHAAVGKTPQLTQLFSSQYSASGNSTLTDGLRGNELQFNRDWLGFSGNDLEAIIDLDTITMINKVTLGTLHNPGNWIFLPKNVEIELSANGIDYFPAPGIIAHPDPVTGNEIIDFTNNNINTEARYIKVTAKNFGVCPEGHPGAGEPAWLFVDEVIVN